MERPDLAPDTFARHVDVVCFSHLRWDFVFQRPQHLMTRCARDRRVFFVEEARPTEGHACLHVHRDASGVWVAVPHVPSQVGTDETVQITGALITDLLDAMTITTYVAWYLTPMALAPTRHLEPIAVVFDCMDELSAFAHAPSGLRDAEAELLRRADLVFTGGWSLYEAKRARHQHVSLFPSSIDLPHFARARAVRDEPADQRALPHPRMGYVGVLDERLDLELIEGVARARPDWQLVMIGPVAKIDPCTLPRLRNIHYLGQRAYSALPEYLAGWDVALMPFARNDATRYISPTKTPEYLAAGRPVVSTSIRDVVTPYGELGLVHIADGVEAFVRAIDAARWEPAAERQVRVDAYLAGMSWDTTWDGMRVLLDELVTRRQHAACEATAAPEMPVRAPWPHVDHAGRHVPPPAAG